MLEELKTGQQNKVIARKLGITEATVKVHIKSLLRKLNVRNRTQAAILAVSMPMEFQQEEEKAGIIGTQADLDASSQWSVCS